MSEWIADRKLLVAKKGENRRADLMVRIGRPYDVEPGTVSFDVGDGVAGCTIEIIGLDSEFREEVYGADLIQALQLAADIDPLLKRYTRKYDFFFPSGEPYFEDGV